MLIPITEEINSWQCSFEILAQSPDEPEIPFTLCQKIRHVSLFCNNEMVKIAEQVIYSAVELCGSPPCDFSAVAFGSLAKGEATPYSDLEYLFLIEEESMTNYFERLAMKSYFIIGNVQETKLKYMNIAELKQTTSSRPKGQADTKPWFEDGAMNGFKIDGLSAKAGNIPSGNGLPGTPENYLIVTPEAMVERYQTMLHAPEPNHEQPGDLTDMLSYTKEFYRHAKGSLLYDNFCKAISDVVPNKLRQDASMTMLNSDICSYDFIPGDPQKLSTGSTSLNLKTDIYRYPSIIVYDLKIILGMKQHGDSWQTLHDMKLSGRLSESLYGCLLFLLSSAQYIRFSAYLHYNSQKDKISVLLQRTDRTRHPSTTGSWHLPPSLLFRVCLLITPTKSHISRSVNNLDMLKESPSFDKFTSAIGFYKTLAEPGNVIKCVVHRYPGLQGMDIFTFYELILAYAGLKKYEECSDMFDDLKATILRTTTQDDTIAFCTKFGGLKKTIFSLNMSLAYMLQACGKVDYAKVVLQEASLHKMDQVEKQDFESLKADILSRSGRSSQAISHFDNNFVTSESEQEDNPTDASQIRDLELKMQRAKLNKSAGLLKIARKEYLSSLKMAHTIYGHESCHPRIASIHEQLASVEISQMNYEEAAKHINNARLAASDDNYVHDYQLLAIELHIANREFKEALRCVLPIVCALEDPSKKPHTRPYVDGMAYMLMGRIYANMSKPQIAREKLLRAITCFEVPIQDSHVQRVSLYLDEALYELSKCYLQSDQPVNALSSLIKCLLGVNLCISQQPKANPSYLNDVCNVLTGVIKVFREKGDVSMSFDDHKSDIRRCYILLTKIYTTKKNMKLANRFMEEANKY